MLKVLYWLIFDGFFIYALLSWWNELGGYIILLLFFVAFFTFELIMSIKELIDSKK